MDGFSDYEKRQILGSYDKLERFKRGKHPERIFNEIRPNYPIRKYVDVLDKLKVEDKIVEKINSIEDVKKDFYKLWINEDSFKKHIEKRLKLSHIKDKDDYILKTINCVINADEYILAIHKDSWNNLCYNRNNNWVVIFNENGEIMTSYKVEPDKKSFEELHKEVGGKIKKGEVDEKVREAFKRLRERYKTLGK